MKHFDRPALSAVLAEGIAAMRQHPRMPAYLERVRAIAQMEAMTCDVLSTVAAE